VTFLNARKNFVLMSPTGRCVPAIGSKDDKVHPKTGHEGPEEE
jgi:hypothetical protein